LPPEVYTGGAADRISEPIDIVLLKAETRPIIAEMASSTAANSATGPTTPTKRRCVAVCNQNGLLALGEKFLFVSAVTR
jgi:hypothetical protein